MMNTCARNMYRYEIKHIVKQILCIKLVKYWDKYTEMHGQQNVKILSIYMKYICLFVIYISNQPRVIYVKNTTT